MDIKCTTCVSFVSRVQHDDGTYNYDHENTVNPLTKEKVWDGSLPRSMGCHGQSLIFNK